MTMTTFQQILSAARQLPKRSQLQLASKLLTEADAPGVPLETLDSLNDAELRALADSTLSPAARL